MELKYTFEVKVESVFVTRGKKTACIVHPSFNLRDASSTSPHLTVQPVREEKWVSLRGISLLSEVGLCVPKVPRIETVWLSHLLAVSMSYHASVLLLADISPPW